MTKTNVRMTVAAGCMALLIAPTVALAQPASSDSTDRAFLRPAIEQEDGQSATGTMTGERPESPFAGNMQPPTNDGEQGFQLGERPELPEGMAQDGSMAQPPQRPEGDLAPELPEGEQQQLTGERPELPEGMAQDGNMAQPPQKPEGDLAPELPEGEQPKLTGERPELPSDAGSNGQAQKPTSATNAQQTNNKSADASQANQAPSEGQQPRDNGFMDKFQEFFRSICDWFSGMGR